MNKKLAEILIQLHISEKSGRGVPRIIEDYGKDAKQLTPIMTGIFKDTSIVSDLVEIIGENMLLQHS